MLPGDQEFVTIHTKWHVVLTTWTWRVTVTRPKWARRWPAWNGGAIERGSQPHAQQVANWCNQYNVDYLSGAFTPGNNPLTEFRKAYWNPATNLGRVKLLHQFWLQHFDANTQMQIENEVASWATDMNSPKYARIRLQNGEERPLILYWGYTMETDYRRFETMIANIRSRLGRPVFIIGTTHLLIQAATGKPGAMRAFQQVDGFYNTVCALPGSLGATWNADTSANKLASLLRDSRDFAAAHGKIFFSGTSPQFDRDLFEQHTTGKIFRLGRTVAQSGAQVRKLLNVAAAHAPVVTTRHTFEADGEHIHEDKWIVLTSLDEWEEGTTFEPSLVRGPLYRDPYYEYDADAMKAISEVFRDRVRRLPVSRVAAAQEGAQETV